CMDDREEGFRRHLETINPDIETFGAAGFFAVAMDWKGLDDEQLTPLCPIVVTPAHAVHEVPQAGQEKTHQKHKQRRNIRIALRQTFLNYTRRNFLSNLLLISHSAPFGLLSLLGKSFVPGSWAKLYNLFRRLVDKQVATELLIHAKTAKPAESHELQLGFTYEEMANRVAGFLHTIGLVKNFSSLIILMGHGSSSLNNPHLAAYDCGACSGRHGGPNARAFANMANRPQVRKLLAEQGIEIPDSSWFIGAEHNTGNEDILWFDRELIPYQHNVNLAKVQMQLSEAQRHSAHERSRRFASTPDKISHDKAYQHVVTRGVDFSQARPELGHATNAAAIIGRRNISQGVFFDRRTFLISYDPSIDPEGRVLENILLNAGPVGAGINLEYYFSTVNNDGYGCGSKITHNIIGNFGILDGTRSDLRTGLPTQMIEIHEAMRLQVVVESKVDIVTEIYNRQPVLQELIGNGWLLVSVKDYEQATIHIFDPVDGFIEWQSTAAQLPTIEKSIEWYQGYSGPRTPALLSKPGRANTGEQHA
ncbi:MAG: Na-translocating system protein MpsB, partial [Thioalkalispiraceae bacterium]